MNPIELVRKALSPEEWESACQMMREPIKELGEKCPFSNHRLFMVYGRTNQFDFPTLPHGSYAYYVANGRAATRLTRKNLEIQTILADEWEHLPHTDSVRLASFILKFFDGGIRASHQVLRDSDGLRCFGNSTHSARNYELNEKEFMKVLPSMGFTQTDFDGDFLSIRAITLRGWMHDKKNLGIEKLRIASDGTVSLSERIVLSKRIFSRVPGIRY